MGFVIPPYNLDPRQYDIVIEDLGKIIEEKFPPEKQAELDYRPLRPEEINTALTAVTRVYNSVIAAVNTRILGAAADAIVPAGSVFAFFGWVVLDDPTGINPIGINALVQLFVEDVIRNEVSLPLVDAQPGHALLTPDQQVIITEQTRYSIQARGAAGGQAIIFPLAYRIAPRSQLAQN